MRPMPTKPCIRSWQKPMRLVLSAVVASALLTACGGGEESKQSPEILATQTVPLTADSAHRFLVQATFGPRSEDIARLRSVGYQGWIDEQFAAPVTSTHLAMAEASAAFKSRTVNNLDLGYTWWTHALQDHNSQLRHKVAFALSQIFVVSSVAFDNNRAVASYLDMLTAKADGNYRDLLEAVALHPAMGQYLSHMSNRKEDGTGRVPDENFAREVMQLFSIGLHELDDAGKPKVVNGQTVDTYSANDIKGLARVFTGFSWHWPSAQSALNWWECFWRSSACKEPSQDVTAMHAYPAEHSTAQKDFLGVSVPVQQTAAPKDSLKVALDRLASHPNTAPFISRQLIQRLVTSNPSDQYVIDVTQVFRTSGGNLKAVVSKILTHPEALAAGALMSAPSTFGKVREPVLRLAHILRAIPHRSTQFTSTGNNHFYLAVDTSDSGSELGQTPMRAPSVFNFYRPGYRPPQTQVAAQGLVAPEMQITTETSVLGYANFLAHILENGWGEWNSSLRRADVQFDFSGWMSLSTQPEQLIDTIAVRLVGHKLPEEAKVPAMAAIESMPTSTDYEKRQRIQAAILLVAVSPDFVIQR